MYNIVYMLYYPMLLPLKDASQYNVGRKKHPGGAEKKRQFTD